MTSLAPFLGVAGGSATIVLIHGGTSTVPKLQAAMPGANVVVVYREGLSSGYSEVSGLAKEYPTLRGLLAKYAPSWQPGTPLVVLGYSAGGWALRYYLRDPSARSDINAAVFLDSLYGAPGDKCDLSPYGGVVEFAKLANQEPANHRLIMTYSQAHPAPGICSETLGKSYAGPGVFVRPAGNADHTAQQGVAGPAVVKELVAPWIGGAVSSVGEGGSGLSLVWLAVGVAVAGAVGVALLRPRVAGSVRSNPISGGGRRLEERSEYPDVKIVTEWEPSSYLPEGVPSRLRSPDSAKEWRELVRWLNDAAKKRGDNTRYHSVEEDNW